MLVEGKWETTPRSFKPPIRGKKMQKCVFARHETLAGFHLSVWRGGLEGWVAVVDFHLVTPMFSLKSQGVVDFPKTKSPG